MSVPNHQTLELLRRVPYFAGLTDESLCALATSARPRKFGRGQVIFVEGDPCGGLHVVVTGEVKIFKLSPQGREQILQQIGPGGTFNEVAVLDGGANPACASALTDATIWIIARADIRRLAHDYPELAWALIESLARRARHLVGMVEDLSLRSVKARLARLLLAEARTAHEIGQIERSQMMSQGDMAARLGTVREMVGRALRDLADEGLIEFDRHRIIIRDQERLQSFGDLG